MFEQSFSSCSAEVCASRARNVAVRCAYGGLWTRWASRAWYQKRSKTTLGSGERAAPRVPRRPNSHRRNVFRRRFLALVLSVKRLYQRNRALCCIRWALRIVLGIDFSSRIQKLSDPIVVDAFDSVRVQSQLPSEERLFSDCIVVQMVPTAHE